MPRIAATGAPSRKPREAVSNGSLSLILGIKPGLAVLACRAVVSPGNKGDAAETRLDQQLPEQASAGTVIAKYCTGVEPGRPIDDHHR